MSRHGYRWYKFDDCGHEQEMSMGAVARLSFLCRECEQTYRLLPSNVYLYEISVAEFKWLKLGYARNPGSRQRRYGLHPTAKVRLIKQVAFDTGEQANFFESRLHRKFRSKKLKASEMKIFMASGASECYPAFLQQVIVDAMSQ